MSKVIQNGAYLNDPIESTRAALDGRQTAIWTAIPGFIVSVNYTAMTCVVQPTLSEIMVDENGNQTTVTLPTLLDVPILYPSGGGFTMTFPLDVGDEVLIVFSSRCIDAWWQLGGVQQAMEARMHDLSDGFAIPGPKSSPNTLDSISSSHLQIRTKDGTAYYQLSSAGLMNLVNATTDLGTMLTNLNSALSAFMTTLAAFSGGGAPVTQAMLQAPAATAETALAAVLVEIEALLG